MVSLCIILIYRLRFLSPQTFYYFKRFVWTGNRYRYAASYMHVYQYLLSSSNEPRINMSWPMTHGMPCPFGFFEILLINGVEARFLGRPNNKNAKR